MDAPSGASRPQRSRQADFGRLALLAAGIGLVWTALFSFSIGSGAGVSEGARAFAWIEGGVLTLLLYTLHRIDRRSRQRAVEADHEIAAIREQADAARSALTGALESLPHGVILVEADWTISLVNQAAVEMLDLPPPLATPGVDGRDVLRHQIRQGELEDDSALRAILDRPTVTALGDAGEHVTQALPVFERKTRSGRMLEIRTTYLDDGRMIRTYTDVTARTDAVDALNAAVRSRSEFLDVVSHELRTPLSAVIGLAGLLQSEDLKAQQKEDLRAIEDAGKHLLEMVNDIMAASSLANGAMILRETSFDLPSALRRSVQRVERQAEAKNLSIALAIDETVPTTVTGDEDRFCTMLLKLLDNALKFTETGGATLSASMIEEDARFHRVLVTVSDTGVGIAPQNLQRLFDPLTQIDSSNLRRFAGVGIGLTLFKQLLNAMGGAVSVTSALGEGTQFRIEIPFRRALKEAFPPAPAQTAPLRVLVAEDVDTNRLVLLQVLRRLGYDARGVANGVEAVGELTSDEYDVVLMDIMMPEMDGIAASRAIRALPGKAARIPIIAITARPLESILAECREAGIDRVESRPINMARLQRVIETVLSVKSGGETIGAA